MWVLEFVLRYWVEWLMTIFAALLALGYRKLSNKMKRTNAENEALKSGMRALLRDSIIRGYNHYMEQERWPIYARDSMLDMFRQYAALGGNGTVKDLMEDLAKLPTEKK